MAEYSSPAGQAGPPPQGQGQTTEGQAPNSPQNADTIAPDIIVEEGSLGIRTRARYIAGQAYTSGLSAQDYQKLNTGRKISGVLPYERPAFGTSPNDVVYYFIRDLDDNFLKSGKVNYTFIDEGNNIRVKPGTDLRTAKFTDGTYKIEYRFFRKVAGSGQTILIRKEPEVAVNSIYSGQYGLDQFGNPRTMTESGPDNGDLLEFENDSYFIHDISSDRTELRIAAKPNINDENYRKVFKDSQYEFSTFVDTDENAYIDFAAEQPNNESLTSLFRIRNGTQPLTENMVGATLKIKNAYVKEVQVSNINTPSYEFGGTYGQDMGMEVEPTDDVLDTQVYAPPTNWNSSLHTDHVPLQNWNIVTTSPAQNSTQQGYHAKFVREGRNGGICGKFIDQNNQFIGNQRMQQMRKINSSQDSPASMGLRHGDTIRIGYYIKSTVVGKGLVFDLNHGMNNPVTEPMPGYTPEIP